MELLASLLNSQLFALFAIAVILISAAVVQVVRADNEKELKELSERFREECKTLNLTPGEIKVDGNP